MTHYPPKDATIALYILWCDDRIEEIFTNKAQAEWYMRELKKEVKQYHCWRIQERYTIEHEI